MERKRTENSWYCTFVLNLSIFTSGPLISYAITHINPLIPILKKIYNETYYLRHEEEMPSDTWTNLLSLSTSISPIGSFIGGISVRLFLTYLTRKKVMVIIHMLNLTGYGIQAAGLGIWGSYEAYIIGRLVVGVAIGAALSTLPIVIGETAVPHRRPLYGTLFGNSLATGSAVGVIIGWSEVLGSGERWFGVLLFGMLPSVVFLVSAYWLPETPYQILLKGGTEKESLNTMKKLRNGDMNDIESEFQLLLSQTKNVLDVKSKAKIATLTEILKTPQYRRHFFGVVILFSFVMVCGLNNILFFSNQLFLNAGLEQNVVTPATIGVMMLSLTMSLTGIYTVRRLEPKRMLLFGIGVMIIGDIFMTTSMATYKFMPWMSTCAIIAMCIFMVGFSVMNSVVFTVIGAITIERTRPVCSNIGSSSHWLCSWFVGFISTYFRIWLGAYAFLVWMVITIFVGLYVILCIPSIAGKTSMEIQLFYEKTKFKIKSRNLSGSSIKKDILPIDTI